MNINEFKPTILYMNTTLLIIVTILGGVFLQKLKVTLDSFTSPISFLFCSSF